MNVHSRARVQSVHTSTHTHDGQMVMPLVNRIVHYDLFKVKPSLRHVFDTYTRYLMKSGFVDECLPIAPLVTSIQPVFEHNNGCGIDNFIQPFGHNTPTLHRCHESLFRVSVAI